VLLSPLSFLKHLPQSDLVQAQSPTSGRGTTSVCVLGRARAVLGEERRRVSEAPRHLVMISVGEAGLHGRLRGIPIILVPGHGPRHVERLIADHPHAGGRQATSVVEPVIDDDQDRTRQYHLAQVGHVLRGGALVPAPCLAPHRHPALAPDLIPRLLGRREAALGLPAHDAEAEAVMTFGTRAAAALQTKLEQ